MSAKGFRGADSKINHCMHSFAEYVARARPQVAVFESVQQAFTKPDGLELMRYLRRTVEERTGEQWTLHHVLHNAYSVGGPSQRRRYFWLISRVPFGIEPPVLEYEPNLTDVIGDLADLERRWDPQPYRTEPSAYARQFVREPEVDGHWWVDNPLTRRIRDLLAGVTWAPGESISTVTRRYRETHGRLPDSFASVESKLVERDFMMGFTTPVRWNGDNHARVITGGSLIMVIHPHLDRTITHREAARILGFPDDWLIEPLKDVSGLQMTWGKGITVHCGRWIGQWIKRALDGEPGSDRGVPIGDREFVIDVTNAWKGRPVPSTFRPSMIQSSGLQHKSPVLVPCRKEHTVTEPNVEAPATVDMETATPTRGRPRPAETIERDEKVFAALHEPRTLAQLAESTGLEKKQVYLSLYRLKRDRRAERSRNGGAHMWAKVGAEAPAE